MEADNERSIKEAGAANGEAAPPLFSAFRPPPRSEPARAEAQPGPASGEKSSAAAMEARLAGLENKLQEAAEKEKARGSDREILDFLKAKTGELEEKLRDAQEKALAFACELKGREEARKESRHETEDLLAEIKRRQEAAEAGLAARIEELAGKIKALSEDHVTVSRRLEKLFSREVENVAGRVNAVSARLDAAAALPARLTGLDAEIKAVSKNLKNVAGHIEAVSVCLEKRFSAQLEDVAGRVNAVSARLGAAEALPARLDGLEAKIKALSDDLVTVSRRLEKLFSGEVENVSGRINAVSARLEAVVKAGLPAEEIGKLRTFFKEDIAAALVPLSGELESGLLAASEKKLDARMRNEFSEIKQAREELKLLVNSMEKSAAAIGEILSGRLGEVREAVRSLSSETAAAGKGAEKAVEWLKGVMKEKGRAAADPIAGSYDLGFIQASLDNLEKCLASALDTLAHAQAGAGIPPGSPEMRAELLMSRHTAALELSVRSLKDGLAAFHAIRPELLKNVKKNLTGE